MSTITRAYHLDIGRQGDTIKHVGINQGIVSREEDMTGNGQSWYERGGTALVVVVERIPKTTLGARHSIRRRRRVTALPGVRGVVNQESGDAGR